MGYYLCDGQTNEKKLFDDRGKKIMKINKTKRSKKREVKEEKRIRGLKRGKNKTLKK